jgi:uncharacterized protein with HEPN domain
MKRDYRVYIDDMLNAISKIALYLNTVETASGLLGDMAMDAVIRNIEIIGEAAGGLPESIKTKHPEIPWKLVSGMRNKLIHEYFGVDRAILLQTIKEDLPPLKQKLSGLIEELS